MAIGPRDLSTLAMKTGWDATELTKWSLADATTAAEVFSLLFDAAAALEAEMSSGLWASLISFTDRPEVGSYRVGTSNGMERHTEYARADSARAQTEGHMLPLLKWDRALAWTWDYLREAMLDDVVNDIADATKDVRDKWRQQILTRLLKRGDDSGTNNGLGSSGLSPGFATAAASTGVDYTPPSNGGTTFDSNHEHYVAISGGVFTNAVFEDAANELREHGHEPPYDFLIGSSDRSTVMGLSKFTPRSDALVQLGITQDRANVNEEYIGVIESFRIREEFGIPQYYGVGYKSYGPLSTRNPLRIRLHKGETRPNVMAMADPRNGNGAHPLQWMMLYLEFGVGVNDRTAGTPRYVNNATWSDGTPT